MMRLSESISVMSRASNAQGAPYLLGFMDQYGYVGLREATEKDAWEYLVKNGLVVPNHNE